MRRVIMAFALLYTMGNAGGCILTQPKEISVDWKAYKTLGKIGVGGEFTSVNYTPAALEGKNFRELLVGSKVAIDTAKIDTGNPERDQTLVTFFFNKISGEKIDATINEIKADERIKGKPRTGTLSVMITMNKKSLIIPMKYHYEKELFKAEGTIDLGDFDALPALASINKSCYDLHSGKTWQDVAIGFNTTIKAELCNVEIKK
ncbi:MAG: YceI family protein [Campylobacterota bacterium]|nr:YceI family protein [Campylobacterota bacterium]